MDSSATGVMSGYIVKALFSLGLNNTWLLMSFLQICSFASVPFIQALTGRNSSCVVAGKNAVFILPQLHYLSLSFHNSSVENTGFYFEKGFTPELMLCPFALQSFWQFPPQMFLSWAELILILLDQ